MQLYIRGLQNFTSVRDFKSKEQTERPPKAIISEKCGNCSLGQSF